MKGHHHSPGFWKSLGFALKGLAYAWKTQGHLRFHCIAAVVVAGMAWLLKLGLTEWLFLIYAVVTVIFAEVVNTAIEVTVDLTQPDFHPLAGIAKDVAAGAVVVTVIQAVFIGLILFVPPLWRLVS